MYLRYQTLLESASFCERYDENMILVCFFSVQIVVDVTVKNMSALIAACSLVVVNGCQLLRRGGTCVLWQFVRKLRENYLLKLAINDPLPLKATRRDAIAKLTSFGASNLSCRQTQCSFIYAVVTREIKLFQNYFRGLFQLMNIFQRVQCR